MIEEQHKSKVEKLPISFKVDANSLAFIDEIAGKVERSRSNFFLFATLKYAKELKDELEQQKDEEEN